MFTFIEGLLSWLPYACLFKQWQHIISEVGKLLHIVHKRKRGAVESCSMQVQDSLCNDGLVSKVIIFDEIA